MKDTPSLRYIHENALHELTPDSCAFATRKEAPKVAVAVIDPSAKTRILGLLEYDRAQEKVTAWEPRRGWRELKNASEKAVFLAMERARYLSPKTRHPSAWEQAMALSMGKLPQDLPDPVQRQDAIRWVQQNICIRS